MAESEDTSALHGNITKLLEREHEAECISMKEEKWQTVYFFDNGENVTVPTARNGASVLIEYLDILPSKLDKKGLNTLKVHVTEILHEHDMETYEEVTDEKEEIEEDGLTFETMGPHLEIIGDLKTITVDVDDLYYDEWLEVVEEELEEL